MTGKGIIITNARQVVIHVNKTWCTITGFSAAEAVGKEGGTKFLQGPKTDAAACARMGAAIRAGQTFSGTVLNYKKARRTSAEHLIATKTLRLHSYGLDAHCR